jgi:excisionase family DNA binding protein
MLAVPVGTLYAWVHQKRVPHIRISGRLVRFDRDELVAWLEGRRVPASPEPHAP